MHVADLYIYIAFMIFFARVACWYETEPTNKAESETDGTRLDYNIHCANVKIKGAFPPNFDVKNKWLCSRLLIMMITIRR